jgi:hypothetical protein
MYDRLFRSSETKTQIPPLRRPCYFSSSGVAGRRQLERPRKKREEDRTDPHPELPTPTATTTPRDLPSRKESRNVIGTQRENTDIVRNAPTAQLHMGNMLSAHSDLGFPLLGFPTTLCTRLQVVTTRGHAMVRAEGRYPTVAYACFVPSSSRVREGSPTMLVGEYANVDREAVWDEGPVLRERDAPVQRREGRGGGPTACSHMGEVLSCSTIGDLVIQVCESDPLSAVTTFAGRNIIASAQVSVLAARGSWIGLR